MENTQEKKVYILEDFRKRAYEAYRGISFSPEVRAESVVVSHSEELESDLAKMPESERERYIQNYRKYLSAWLSAMSRCLSSMITGPANFPVRRNQKANDSEHKRSVEFTEWRKRALEAIEKNRLANRSEKEVSNDKWASIRKSILSSAATIIAIDTKSEGGRGYNRTLFVNSITGLVKRIAQDGDIENLNRSLEYIKELNKLAVEKYQSPKPIITDNNSIWGLSQIAEVAREVIVDKENRRNEVQEISFPNTLGTIEVIKNHQIDRIQIMFPDKPSEEVRGILKNNAFKWSPSQGVWQRQLTGNAEYAVKTILGHLSQIETNEVGRMAIHG